MRSATWLCLLLAVIAWASLARAGEPAQQGQHWHHFSNPALENRYQSLLGTLRCLVCQDESLADSNAGLAADLRGEIFQMMKAGKSNQQIKQYLVDRYGDYVLFKPPLDPRTYLLWFGPFILVALGLMALVWSVRNRSRARNQEISDEERARIEALLNEEERKTTHDV